MLARLLLLSSFAAVLVNAAACGAGGDKPEGTTSASPTATATCPPAERARVQPGAGPYFGVNLDWGKDSPSAYAERLGAVPAVFVTFAPFPPQEADWANIDAAAEAAGELGASLMLTLEPHGGLRTVRTDSAGALAERLRRYNERGVPVFVRFAHEMNGSWYPWSQDPAGYVDAFRTIAAAVHGTAPATAMVWAPNYGGGYPFSGGRYEAQPGTAAFSLLDTNTDGILTMADDPYAPYYPGDDAVDWVGMSLYHWGSAHPWGENERPEAGKFVAQLRGEYDGLGGDDSAVPDFYGAYAVTRGKPLAIPETAAFYAPASGGDPEAAIKAEWWSEVFAGLASLPAIGIVSWFEWSKFELEVNGDVDWRVTSDAEVAAAFRDSMPANVEFADPSAACR